MSIQQSNILKWSWTLWAYVVLSVSILTSDLVFCILGNAAQSLEGLQRRDSAQRRASALLPVKSNLLVISGGDGYEDFRLTNSSETVGRDDSTNHLLLWRVWAVRPLLPTELRLLRSASRWTAHSHSPGPAQTPLTSCSPTCPLLPHLVSLCIDVSDIEGKKRVASNQVFFCCCYCCCCCLFCFSLCFGCSSVGWVCFFYLSFCSSWCTKWILLCSWCSPTRWAPFCVGPLQTFTQEQEEDTAHIYKRERWTESMS